MNQRAVKNTDGGWVVSSGKRGNGYGLVLFSIGAPRAGKGLKTHVKRHEVGKGICHHGGGKSYTAKYGETDIERLSD